MPLENVRGVTLNTEVLGNRGPWVAREADLAAIFLDFMARVELRAVTHAK